MNLGLDDGLRADGEGATGMVTYGTRGSPQDITAGGGITYNGNAREMQFIQGSGAAVNTKQGNWTEKQNQSWKSEHLPALGCRGRNLKPGMFE